MKDAPLSRRDFLKLIGAGSATIALNECLGKSVIFASDGDTTKPKRSPNIIIILADDLGYGELGCQGNKEIPTPNIDSIAKAGVRFTNGYVSCPVCSPTRAGLMTGRYQERFGHELNPGPAQADPNSSFGLPLSETTVATRLKSAGYKTGLVGKWHLGHFGKYHPLQRGFDEFFGFLGGAHSYTEPGKGNNAVMRGDKPVDEKEYLTDAFSREATSFIDRHKSEPFFLYLAFNAVHSPLQAPEKYLRRFPNIQGKRKTFAAMLSAMDDAVGKVLETLRKNGLEEDTLIFFLSDNGGPTPSTTSGNGPLRGYKGQVYEGGFRVPFMAQWKGKIPGDRVLNDPVISLDISPTVVAVAGASSEGAKYDGVDILPYLSGKSTSKPHETLYWRFGSQHAVRFGNWKLVKTPQGSDELYDLSSDIGEKTDLAAKNPEKLKELQGLYARWDSELVRPLWVGRKEAIKQMKQKKGKKQ